ncbi:hypothetical protein I6I18_12515 [Kytococcus sedentarius]|uniref:carbamoyltransferase C-terminal domain-containing protein n=1 Tax=Kytococcus sedentarius TaxID=1276 RepID=UPI00145F461F|nr:carbamoyltransferase C-terminal domain-containing protein [Kytococcus sedentarius]QQB63796.1 hypothetical protein I6I18_12515 [Kytococcus sedentarius]
MTAAHLAAGEVVGWFQGPTEGGPRALGGRSILADPRSVDLRDHVNRDVKRRETWRPFAPSMLSSEAERFVDRPWDADFMIVAYLASEQARTEVPGVVHVDGTMRPQFVDDDADTPYARVLGVFKEHTGAGGLLNTSFNNEAEPIVSSPLDAIRTFFSTPLDVLAIGGCLVRK